MGVVIVGVVHHRKQKRVVRGKHALFVLLSLLTKANVSFINPRRTPKLGRFLQGELSEIVHVLRVFKATESDRLRTTMCGKLILC